MATRAIILSGGHGTRLWPASRPSRPKQFLPLIEPRSMFQATVERMAVATRGAPPLVVAGADHAADILRQLAQSGVRDATVLIEPTGRDSAPAMAAAAAWIVRDDPEAIGVMVASDHFLPDAEAFRTAVDAAIEVARDGAIVTFGIAPSSPSDAYGYIRPGRELAPGSAAREVAAFAEKPHVALARDYVAAGYLWNSGNFVFRAQTLLDELDAFAPEVAAAARVAVAQAQAGAGLVRLGEAFRAAPKISIDYAVMEKTRRAAVAPLDLVWSDLGAWDAVLAASPRDAQGNAVTGEATLMGAHGCLIRARPGQRVVALGVSDIGVVVEDDAILVCDLAVSQGVKQVVERLKREGLPEVDAPAGAASSPASPPPSLRAASPEEGGDRERWSPLPSGKVDAKRTEGADPASRLTHAAAELGAWLRTQALPLWWTLGADHDTGGFRDLLALDGAPVAAPRRARVQARQTYVFALAGALGWRGPWRQAALHGWSYLQSRFARGEGGFRTLLDAGGEPADEAVMLYDQAFVLLALAWMRRTEVIDDAEAQAQAIVARVLEPRRGDRGGFREAGAQAWLANPHMHLFEAMLAWEAVSASPVWPALADELAELALARFVDAPTGALRETFAADWSFAPGEAGGVVEPGHQFEWAWLLAGWGRRRGRDDALAAARRLYAVGEGAGIDHARGVAVNRLDAALNVADAQARLWPQTERLKAALRLSDDPDASVRGELLRQAAEAVDALRRYLSTPTPGLWRDVLDRDDAFVPQPAPASSLYHIACAVAELEAWAAQERKISGPGDAREGGS